MQSFAYVARDASGKRILGEVSAASSSEAARSLRGEGKIVVSVTAAVGGVFGRSPTSATPAATAGPMAGSGLAAVFATKVKPDEVRAFIQSLSVMISTGVSLSEALQTCVDVKSSPTFARTLADVIGQVEGGTSFSAALTRHPRVFSPLVVNMVKASEASGQLGPMLRRVAQFLTNQRELSRKIKGAVTYPIVMVVLASGVLTFMVTFVLPKFAKIYANRQDALPAITKILLQVSGWMTSYGLYVGPVVLAGVITAVVHLRRPAGRPLADRIRLGLPLLGPLFHKTYLARTMRTLGTLLQSGVSLLNGVDLTRAAVGNTQYSAMLAQAHEHLQSGRQLSDALSDSRLIPRAVNKMLQSGERGGSLGDVMDQIATHCEDEVAVSIKTVTSLIEPAIVIFVGGIVGTIVLALLLPIFTISKALQPH